MRNKAAKVAAEEYDKVHEIIGHLPPNKPWELIRDSGIPIDQAREAYANQERVKALRASGDKDLMWESPDDFLVSREQYIQAARNRAITTFAVIKDGKWYKHGDMGWWGAVADEKDQELWNQEFNKLIDSVSNDTLLSVYDCHI